MIHQLLLRNLKTFLILIGICSIYVNEFDHVDNNESAAAGQILLCFFSALSFHIGKKVFFFFFLMWLLYYIIFHILNICNFRANLHSWPVPLYECVCLKQARVLFMCHIFFFFSFILNCKIKTIKMDCQLCISALDRNWFRNSFFSILNNLYNTFLIMQATKIVYIQQN